MSIDGVKYLFPSASSAPVLCNIVCPYIHIHTYSRIDTSVDKKLYFVLVCVCIYISYDIIHICIHMHTYAYICIHMHTYAYICTKQIQVAFWSEHVEVRPYTPVQHRVPGHFNYGFQHQEFSNRGARPEWSGALGPAHPKEYPEGPRSKTHGQPVKDRPKSSWGLS